MTQSVPSSLYDVNSENSILGYLVQSTHIKGVSTLYAEPRRAPRNQNSYPRTPVEPRGPKKITRGAPRTQKSTCGAPQTQNKNC